MAKAALVAERHLSAGDDEEAFHHAKVNTARFYADHVLVKAAGLAHTVISGAEGALSIEEDRL
jgi:hypothetical protein